MEEKLVLLMLAGIREGKINLENVNFSIFQDLHDEIGMLLCKNANTKDEVPSQDFIDFIKSTILDPDNENLKTKCELVIDKGSVPHFQIIHSIFSECIESLENIRQLSRVFWILSGFYGSVRGNFSLFARYCKNANQDLCTFVKLKNAIAQFLEDHVPSFDTFGRSSNTDYYYYCMKVLGFSLEKGLSYEVFIAQVREELHTFKNSHEQKNQAATV